LFETGTHNSFSYTISPSSDVGPDEPQAIQDLIKMFGTAGKDIMYRWSATQNLNVTQQLEHGIRYLSCRVCWCPEAHDFLFLHRLLGNKVTTCLEEVNKFLESHPKEIVILDLNHFYNMSTTDHKNLLTLLTDLFGSKMCLYVDLDSVTMEMMWENNLQVLIFYQHDIAKDYLTFWPTSVIRSPWANTSTISHLMTFLDTKYKAGRPNQFYVWQGILTPSFTTILTNFTSSLKDCQANKLAPFFVSWLKDKKVGTQGISICTMDFVEMANFIPTVVCLNH